MQDAAGEAPFSMEPKDAREARSSRTEVEIEQLIAAIEQPETSADLRPEITRRLRQILTESRRNERRVAELYRREQAARAAAEAAAQALAESEARYRAMGEAIAFGIWECSPDGRPRYLSHSFLELLNMPWLQVQDEGFFTRIHLDDRRQVQERWEASLRTGKHWDCEFRIVSKEGEVHTVLSRGRPVFDDDQQITSWVGIHLDLTERKAVEAELRESEAAREAAEAANRAKDEFLAVLSHELRTPLTPVLATMTYLEQRVDLPGELRGEVSSLRRNVEMEARLIDDLLDLTRISRGKIELHHEVLDAHACLRNALEICQRDVESKELEVSLNLWAKSHHVWADPARMQQVFWNLIKNATKFTPKRGKIVLRTSNDEEGMLRLEVLDNGVGIEPHLMPRIFNAFEQGDRTVARRFGGLGLGLTISRALVDMHGGRLCAQSAGRDQGATFTIELKTVPLEQVSVHLPLLPEGDVAATHCRILLVEDHEDTLRILSKLLRGFGYDVRTASTVAAALEAAARESFDLLVSDLGLPDGSGLDVMSTLKSRYGLKGIALSGFGMDEDLRRSREAGFEQHLTKPVNFQTLEGLIKRLAN